MSGEVLYHVWFATKRRKWLLQGDIEDAAKSFLWSVAEEKGIKLLGCETVVDHVHLLVEITPKESLSRALNLLKGLSSRRLFLRFPELKIDADVNNFWQRRYGAKIVPKPALKRTLEYIRTQKERLEKFERFSTAP